MESIENIYAVYTLDDSKKHNVNEKLYTTTNNVEYKILNYDSDYLCFNREKQVNLYRSVIFSMPEKEILSFSPQKSIDKSIFCKKYDIRSEDIYINEYIDGTLVHLFYDNRIKKWEIATKSAIGGNYKLYNKSLNMRVKLTVLEMFIEAFTRNIYSKNNDLNTNIVINNFSKKYCYSFVLLHPCNPIIFPITQPKLYLTNVFDVSSKNGRVISIPPNIFQHWGEFNGTTIMFPITKRFYNWDMLKPEILIHSKENDINCGYIATHLPSGERCMFYNGHYNELLRMQTIKSQYLLHYLCLRRIDKLNDFLVKNPSNRKCFRLFKDHFSEFVENMHVGYLMKYVWKLQTDTSNKYNPYIDQMHREIFLPNIKKNEKITKKKVFEFLMKKHPGELIYVLFSDKRSYS